MRPILIATAAMLFVAPAFAETKNYNFTGFKKIEASVAYRIEFVQGPNWSVSVDSKTNDLDKVVVEMRGDTLVITRPKDIELNRRVEDVVRITAPDIDALKLSTAIQFKADRLDVDSLDIDTGAAVHIEIANLKAGPVNVHGGAAMTLDLKGTCGKLDLDLGAANKVFADGLKCRETNVDAGAASTVEAYASEKAVAHAGAASTIRISGKPKTFEKSGSGYGSKITLAD